MDRNDPPTSNDVVTIWIEMLKRYDSLPTKDQDLYKHKNFSQFSGINEVFEAFRRELFDLLSPHGQDTDSLSDIERLFDQTLTAIHEILSDEVNLSPCYAAMCSIHSVNSAKICQWLFLKE